MTLNNARRRFAAMGCELERSHAYGRYKYRSLTDSRWRYGDCLESLLIAAHGERLGPKKLGSVSTGDMLLMVLAA
jgi:hypothetical protein